MQNCFIKYDCFNKLVIKAETEEAAERKQGYQKEEQEEEDKIFKNTKDSFGIPETLVEKIRFVKDPVCPFVQVCKCWQNSSNTITKEMPPWDQGMVEHMAKFEKFGKIWMRTKFSAFVLNEEINLLIMKWINLLGCWTQAYKTMVQKCKKKEERMIQDYWIDNSIINIVIY